MTTARGLMLCADLFHTQGAAMYVFRSYLSIAIALARRLDVPVGVMIPRTTNKPFGFGLPLDTLYTQASLAALAKAGGFTWHPYDHDTCSWAFCDARIGERLHIHRRNATFRDNAFAPPELYNDSLRLLPPFDRSLIRNSPPRDPLSVFLADMFSYLQKETVELGQMSVSLLMIHWTAGPLAHAAMVLPDRALVDSVLNFAHTPTASKPFEVSAALEARWPYSRSGDAKMRNCAYVYVRLPISNGLNVARSLFSGHRWRNEHEKPVLPLHEYAAFLVGTVRRLGPGLSCMYVNALVQEGRGRTTINSARALEILREEANRSADGQATRPLQVLASFKQPSMRAAIRDCSGPCNPLNDSTLSIDKYADWADNLHERNNALAAPLLLTEGGTHWSDPVLHKRVAAGLPSAVIMEHHNFNLTRITPYCFEGSVKPSTSGANVTCKRDLGCDTFHRGRCIGRFRERLDSAFLEETKLCHTLMYRCDRPLGLQAEFKYALYVS